jgi:hypothetical protein
MGFSSLIRHSLRHARNFDERRRQCIGTTADTGTEPVGGILARAADRHLHDHGSKRRQDEHEQRANDAKATVVVAPSPEKHAKLRKHGDSAGDGGGNGHRQRVVIANVSEFVTDDAGDFVAAKRVEKPCRRADGSVLRISPGSEGVGLGAIH